MTNDTSKREDYAKSVMESYVKQSKIFIDTCSLLHFAAEKFWMNMVPLLRKYGARVIVPLRSIEEIEKHSKNMDKPDLATNAKNTLKIMQQLISAGFVEVRGEETDNFADNVFQVVFTKFRMTHKLLLITQDNNLAKDILALNGIKSVRANMVSVKRINKYGFLSGFAWEGNAEEKAPRQTKPRMRNADKSVENNAMEEEVFKVCKTVTTIADNPLRVSHIPKEQESVYTTKVEVKLLKEVAAGGEGIIYTTNTKYVAKIYKRENITRRKYEKIKLLLTKPIFCDGICSPIAPLYNAHKEFVGYLMCKAYGIELQKSIFIKPLFMKKLPNWKKRDTVELCVTILEKIKYLHDRNIIMGDINPSNILVVSPKEVYFVDTDSYQIEDLPCPVGTNNYTAPEIQRKHFANFLRTSGNENFAVATLLFMIMLPGKPPYSQQGGEDPIANIINMDFSYPFGESTNKKTPDGPWRYIWSHLTYDLKKAFYNTFRKGGENSTEQTRLTVDEWLPIFRYYLELLDSGKYGKQDKMSEELFPTRHKKNPNLEYTTCKLCHNEAAENQCQNGICRDCLNKGEVYRCKKCGKEILYTNYQKYIKNARRHDTCPECFEHGNRVRISPRCIDCGRTFDITNNQYDYFRSKGFDVPKRCPACREAKKNRPSGSTYGHSNSSTYPSGGHSYERQGRSSGGRGSFCFITTALCDYYGKEDNCVELETLRNYRDTWLRHQPDGQIAIAEYYNKAPLLVSLLKASDQYEEYCEMLWQDYLQPCLELIHSGAYEECKELYYGMVEFLEIKLKQQ